MQPTSDESVRLCDVTRAKASAGCYVLHAEVMLVWWASPSILWSGGELVECGVMSDEAGGRQIT
jgi:hypothetical protein